MRRTESKNLQHWLKSATLSADEGSAMNNSQRFLTLAVLATVAGLALSLLVVFA